MTTPAEKNVLHQKRLLTPLAFACLLLPVWTPLRAEQTGAPVAIQPTNTPLFQPFREGDELPS